MQVLGSISLAIKSFYEKNLMQRMEESIQIFKLGRFHNSLRDLSLEKGYAKDKIRRFLKKCEEKREMPVIYYSGHGEMGTGNWCFAGMEIKI